MDRFATASCGGPRNVALSDPAIVKPYWDLAAGGAIADRYFQPVVGQSSANDMYFARAGFVFNDNDVGPKDALGLTCGLAAPPMEFTEPTIGDLLTAKGVPWTFFAEGYGAMAEAVSAKRCPDAPEDCPAQLRFYPCVFDPSDVPFQYYPSTRDNGATMKDLSAFEAALNAETLPAVSFVKPIGYKTEHPGLRNKLSAGVEIVTTLIDEVLRSPYRNNTLVLVAYDEGGGYFDHVAPPPPSTVDGKPYGTRVPLIAVGKLVRKNFVSHVVLEHSSIVKLIEWNWLDQTTGQLKTRDAVVNNLGSLLDPAATGVAVPE
jgi:phospholipase C